MSVSAWPASTPKQIKAHAAIMDDRPDLPEGIDGALPTSLFHSIYFSHSGGFLILNPSKAKHRHLVKMAVITEASASRD